MANTLYEFYQGQGQSLPSIQDRSKIYEQAGLGSASTYQGTAQQNTSLLGYLQKPISATALNTTVQPANLPPAPVDTNNYPAMTLGGQATIDTLNKQTADAENEMTSIFDKYLGSQQAPTNPLDTYNQLYGQSGIGEAQTKVNEGTNKINALSAQLQGITAEQQAQQLQTAKEGISQQGLGARNITLERNNAIRALPIQAQVLAEQAKLTGNTALLAQAQQKFNQVFEIQTQYQQQVYEFNQKKIDAVYEFASKQQQRKLDLLREQRDREYQTQKDMMNSAQEMASNIFKYDPATASKIAAINWSSPTARQEYSKLLSEARQNPEFALDLALKQAQISKLRAETSGLGTESFDGYLNETEIKKIDQSPQGKKTIALGALKQKIQNYYDLVKKHGTETPLGGQKKLIDSAYADAQVAWKEAAALGALTGPDLGLIEKALPPATYGGIFAPFQRIAGVILGGGQSKILSTLDNTLQSINKEATTNISQLYSRDPRYASSFYVQEITQPFADVMTMSDSELQRSLDQLSPEQLEQLRQEGLIP